MESKVLKLRILTVSIKLKFKCKLRIDSAEGALTQEVSSSNSIFSIEEELHLYPKTNNVELSLMLISEKGSQYNGGTIKTTLEQLRHSLGSPLKLSISKCIDKEAWIEVKAVSVPDIDGHSSQKELSFTQQRVQNRTDFMYTPERMKKGNLVIESNLGQTRSQHGFMQPSSSINLTQERKRNFQTTRPVFGEFSNVRMQRPRQGRPISPLHSTPRRDTPQEWATQEEISKVRQEVDFSASKLKKLQDKLKQEQEKSRQERQIRKNVQSSEQGYKLQLVKLSISKEEREKQLEKKDSKIKELQTQNKNLKQQIKKAAQFKDDLNAKNAQNANLREEIQAYKAELAKTQSMRVEQQERITKLQKDAIRLNEQKQEFIDELAKKLQTKDEQLKNITDKLNKLSQENQRQKKIKFNTDYRFNQIKSDYEKTVAYLKKELKTSKEDYSLLQAKTDKQRVDSQKEMTSLREECQRLKVGSSKLSIERRSLEEQISSFEETSAELKRYRQKFTQESNRHKSCKEDLSKLRKKYESTLQANHKLEERLKNSYHTIEEYNRSHQARELRCSELEERNRRMEDQVIECTNLLEKHKRNEEALTKECFQAREKEKQLKAQLSRKELEFTKLKLQLQNINQKLQTRQTLKIEHQQKPQITTYHHDEWQQSKMASMVEAQKYLQMEIINQKHAISEFEAQAARHREEVDRLSRQEYEWRELERTWEAQKLRLTTENTKFSKQLKELTKRVSQEDAKSLVLAEKIEKEKKNAKNWQEKFIASQAALKKVNTDKEEISSQLQIRQARLKMIDNEIMILKGENQLREAEAKKIKSVNDILEAQNRRLREEVGDLSLRLKEEQQTSASETKRAREEMSRYESRLTACKKQSEKFKESLRSVLVESIISQLSKEQQESQAVTKKREGRLGLTLSNELIIKLEEYLRELTRHKFETEVRLRASEKELGGLREELILKTNQFQNSEAQLKLKLDELIQNLNKMKQIYESRQEEMRKSLTEAQWDLAHKQNEIDRISQALTDATRSLEAEAKTATENWGKTEKALTSELEKLRAKSKEQAEREASYSQQVVSLEEYITALEEKVANYRDKEFQNEQQLEKMTRQIIEIKTAYEGLTLALETANKQKAELKTAFGELESELQESKMMASQYKGQLEDVQREKREQSTLIRNIMKEKETLLHQYLASEEKAFQLESKLFQTEETLSQLTSQQEEQARALEQLREQKKKSGSELKSAQAALSKKQSQIKELQEKLREKEKNVTKLSQQITILENSLSQLRFKLDASNKQGEARIAQIEQALELKDKEILSLITHIEAQKQRNEKAQQQLKKVRAQNEKLRMELQQAGHRLSETLYASEKNEAELFSARSEVSQLREEIERAREELEQKDLKNYMLSSQQYKIQQQASEQLASLQEKLVTQEEAMLRYEEICQEYSAEIQALKQARESLATRQADTQSELLRLEARCRTTEEEREANAQTVSQLRAEVERLQEGRLKLQVLRSSEEQRAQETFLAFEQEVARKDSELQRTKHENQLLHETLRKLQESCRTAESELQEALQRAASDAETSRRHELQMRKMREDVKQLQWSNEREVRKVIQAKLRSCSDAEEGNSLGEQLKGLEESILQILKSYDSI